MKNVFLIFVILTLPYWLISQTKDDDYYMDISRALGYSYNIEITFDLIKEKYPDLAGKALIAQHDFNLAHRKSVECMEDEVSKQYNLGKGDFKILILNQVNEQFKSIDFAHSKAEDYIRNFTSEMIKGNHEMYQRYVQILLRHNPTYKSNPAKEYVDGYRTILNTDNHPKSKGLSVSIEYPKSWIEQEGKRPNIIKLIKSYDNECAITLGFSDIFAEMGLQDFKPSQEELGQIESGELIMKLYDEVIDYSYGEEFISGTGLDEIADYTFKKTKIEGQPAIIVKASGKVKRGDIEMRVYKIYYLIYYKKYMIVLSSMINNGLDGNLNDSKAKYEMLSDLIFNSLIIKDKWK